MALKKLSYKKRAEIACNAAMRETGAQVSVFDIPKIFDLAEALAKITPSDNELLAKIKTYVETLRKN